MESVLIVSSREKATEMIVDLFKGSMMPRISIAKSSAEARRMLSVSDFDLAVINAPLSDEYGHETAEICVMSTNASCLMIVKNEHYESVSQSVEPMGIMTIEKPINKTLFLQAIRFINASRNRMSGLRNENQKLHKRIEEMKLVNRAKFALMQYLGFDENQAHRYLEKQAMNKRVTKREVAIEIIKIYEN